MPKYILPSSAIGTTQQVYHNSKLNTQLTALTVTCGLELLSFTIFLPASEVKRT